MSSFLHFFSKQAQQKPSNISITCSNQAYTYLDTDTISNKLARFLLSRGIKKGDVIGVSCRNSPSLIFSLLGILKSEAIYLPLDPEYPADRLEGMIKNAQPTMILVEETFFNHFSKISNSFIMNLNSVLDKNLDSFPTEELNPAINPEQIAYIIYTSGSTGVPKGIQASHQNTANTSINHINYYPKHIKALLFGSISFDVSLLVIFHTLANGGELCISSDYFDVDGLIELINNNQINHMMLVPSVYSALLDRNIPLPSLLTVSSTGEPLPSSLVLLHKKLVPNAILYNEYGPSEIAIGSTIAQICSSSTNELTDINAGHPLPGTEIRIYDDKMDPLPKGEIGEILIGGAGLTLGYLNNPDATQNAFVKIIQENGSFTYFYRTGDLGYFTSNETLKLLGRKDNQVKIRGQRIELDEIQSTLEKYPSIDQAIVIPVKVDDSIKKLVAFYVSKITSVKSENVKAYLRESLTPAMIPSEFIKIQAFPLTPNGKIDRESLLKMMHNQNIYNSNRAPGIHSELRKIWEEALSTANFNNDDNFFDLGGDSLLLANLQAAIDRKFHVLPPLVLLLQNTTINDQAKLIEDFDNNNAEIATSSSSEKRKQAFSKLRNKKK